MDMEILPCFMTHLNNFVRFMLHNNQHHVVCIDGHFSLNGLTFLYYSLKNYCEIVLCRANTSHFLRPCYQKVNKRLKSAMRTLRDEFNKAVIADTESVRFNLVCAVYACRQITTEDITRSFHPTGLCRFNTHFPSGTFRHTEISCHT